MNTIQNARTCESPITEGYYDFVRMKNKLIPLTGNEEKSIECSKSISYFVKSFFPFKSIFLIIFYILAVAIVPST